jgi:hypothetical protein
VSSQGTYPATVAGATQKKTKEPISAPARLSTLRASLSSHSPARLPFVPEFEEVRRRRLRTKEPQHVRDLAAV